MTRKTILSFGLLACAAGAWLVLKGCTGVFQQNHTTQVSPPVRPRPTFPVEPSRRPLIYFSEIKPSRNELLKQAVRDELKLSDDRKLALTFGQNVIPPFSILIIKGRGETAMQFDHISQLFRFLVRNGWHSTRRTYSYPILTETLFYNSKPLELTCGKYSTYFTALAIAEMGMKPNHCRSVSLYPDTGGMHVLREFYFEELKKWVMFDVDSGVTPILDGNPFHMLELALATDTEYHKAIKTGLKKYGRGPMDNQFGKGPGAKRWADALLKTGRHHFAVRKIEHFLIRPKEAMGPYAEAVMAEAKLRDPKRVKNYHDPEFFRYRFYTGTRSRMNEKHWARVRKEAGIGP